MTQELPDDYSPYPKSLIGRTFSCFSDWTEHLTGTGGWKVKPLHQRLLDAFLPSLEPDIRALLEQQLAQPFFMQFWHKGRVSPFFFKNFRLPREIRIPYPEFEDRLYKVEMFVDGRKQQAHIVFVSGRIHRIEFKKPFKFYEGKDIRFGATSLGKPKQSLTVAIDREEHGKNGKVATGEE
jgi:hypothetical protein